MADKDKGAGRASKSAAKSAAKKSAAKSAPKPAPKGAAIGKDQSVFHGGRFYTAGQEQDLHNAGLDEDSMAALEERGVISGFSGARKEVDEDSLADDPTIKAGEADGMDLGEEVEEGPPAAATQEVVHRPGRNAPEEGSGGKAAKRGRKK